MQLHPLGFQFILQLQEPPQEQDGFPRLESRQVAKHGQWYPLLRVTNHGCKTLLGIDRSKAGRAFEIAQKGMNQLLVDRIHKSVHEPVFRR